VRGDAARIARRIARLVAGFGESPATQPSAGCAQHARCNAAEAAHRRRWSERGEIRLEYFGSRVQSGSHSDANHEPRGRSLHPKRGKSALNRIRDVVLRSFREGGQREW